MNKPWELYVFLRTGEDFLYGTFDDEAGALAAAASLASSPSLLRSKNNVRVLYPIWSVQHFVVRHVSTYQDTTPKRK